MTEKIGWCGYGSRRATTRTVFDIYGKGGEEGKLRSLSRIGADYIHLKGAC